MHHIKIELFLIIIMALVISGCEKAFTEDEMNKLSVDKYDDLVFAMAGLNYRFASMAEGNISGLLANADDVITNINFTSSGMMDHCIQSGISSSPSVESVYIPLYQTIACANDILSKTGNLNQADRSIQNVLGEIYFMRAYSYFWLVRIYGQIPLIDNVDVDYTIKKASFNEIYSFIEKDLQQAISFLPNSSNEARISYVTPHRGTAKALLSQVYLTMGGYPLKDTKMYDNAAKMAREVIDSAAYFGFGLLPDLADLWNGKHRTNKESMFSIFSTSPSISDWSDYRKNPWKYRYYATDLHFSSYSGGNVAIQFYNTFPKSYRKDVTYRTYKTYIYNPPCVTDSLNPLNTYCPPPETIVYYVDSMNLCTGMSFRKQSSNFDNTLSNVDVYSYDYNTPTTDSGSVITLLRFSHVLLTYAEAKARSGNLDASAFEAVNQIRRRANKVDIFSPSVYDMEQDISAEQFADSVVWERAWEFCDEPEGRWFDLLRLEMLKDIKHLKYPGQGEVWPVTISGNYFFPIPQSDKMLNTNL